VVMSGIIAVYGLVMAVLISGDLSPSSNYSLFKYVKTRFVITRLANLSAALCILQQVVVWA
jgi:hypothetical protein